MLRLPAIFVCFLLATTLVAAEPVTVRQIIGSWKCVSATIDGRPLAGDTAGQLRLTMTPDRYKTERGDQVLFDSTYTIDTAKQPAQIDMVGTEGDLKGKVSHGYFMIVGDMITIC